MLKNRILNPIIFGIVFLIILEFLVIPGLHSPKLGVGMLSVIALGIMIVVGLLYSWQILSSLSDKSDNIQGGETDIDYINPDELKGKKKK